MSGIQNIIKPIPDYNMIPICYRKGRAVPRQRNLDEFLGCGKKDTGNLMPKNSTEPQGPVTESNVP